jgi:small-conductance mechanosensitive channel
VPWLDDLVAKYLTPPTSWPIAIVAALLTVAVLELVYRFGFRWLTRLAGATKTRTDDVLIKRMRLPAQVLVFLVGASVLFTLRGFENAAVSMAVTIVEMLLLAYLAIEALETAVIDFWLGERMQVKVPGVVRGLALIVLYTAAILSIVGSTTGVNLAPVLATSTVVTVVLGLALQDTLGNLFAGLALSLDRPFAPGDWILVDGVEGRVQMMGWRSVHLETFTRDVVVMPNSVIAKARVQNFAQPQAPTGRRVDVIVSPTASPADVEACAAAAIAKVGRIQADGQRVWLIQMTPLAHHYDVRVFVDEFGVHDDVESDLRKAFVTEAAARGIAVKAAAVAAVSA